MEPRFADLLPEVLLGLTAEQFAAVAAAALAPRAAPVVSTAHLHVPRTTVLEQTVIVTRLLRAAGRASFAELASGCEDTYEIVARFLAVLDLYRDKCVSFEQDDPARRPVHHLDRAGLRRHPAHRRRDRGRCDAWPAGLIRRQAEMIEEPLPDSGESRSGLQPALEAILLVADEPVPENTLAQVLEVAQQDVAAALHQLAGDLRRARPRI